MISFDFPSGNPNCPDEKEKGKTYTLDIFEEKANSFLYNRHGVQDYEDEVDKSNTGYPVVRILSNTVVQDTTKIEVSINN